MNQVNSNLWTGRTPWWVVGLCVAVCFVGIFDRDLWTPDEPRVAAISLKMSRNGNVIVPELAGELFIEKPPLYFALAAELIRIIGPIVGNTGAIRFLSAIFALGTLSATFLMARRFGGSRLSVPAVLILATSYGFVEHFHWIRVDAALAFFVAAALWCFVEMYYVNRPWYCLPAGVFAAGAFLSKGFIGPVMIGIGWIGLAVPTMISFFREKGEKSLYLRYHAVGFILFAILSGSWMLLFRHAAGKELWHTWFWDNQLGRFLGSSLEFQHHLHPLEPFYYIVGLGMYTLPWLPLIVVWLGDILKKLWKNRIIDPSNLFLIVCGFGTIFFLTLSVSKRYVYLMPALPTYAIMCAGGLQKTLPRWCEFYFKIVIPFVVITALAILTGFPLISKLIPETMPAAARQYMATFSFKNLISGAGLVLCLFLLLRSGRLSLYARTAAMLALFCIAAFAGPVKAIDIEKSMHTTTTSFIARIPPEERPKIASYMFDESLSGYFYYYCNWPIPQITDPIRLRKIVAGLDPEFDSVIVRNKNFPSPDEIKLHYQVVAESHPSHTNRKKQTSWIKILRKKN